MATTHPKFVLGQPVICAWDYRGTTLGIVVEKRWHKIGCQAFWNYSVKRKDGSVYEEQEGSIYPVRFKKSVLKLVRG